MKYKVAAIQMEVKTLDKQKNLTKALSLLEDAAADGAKAVCFPDYFLTDTPTKDMVKTGLKEIVEPIPGPTIDTFSKAAKKLSVYIVVGGMLEIGEDNKIYSTSAFLGPNGELIGKVRKTHPENAPVKHELGCGVTPGPGDYPIFDTEIGKIGIMIDMDGVAVEVPRILGLKGAEVVFWPVSFSSRFTDLLHLMNRYNSYAARFAYVVSACKVGLRKNAPVHEWGFFGEERVDLVYGGGTGITFGGSYLAMVGDFSEGIAIATVDTEKPRLIRKLRKDIMPFERRPETYDLITKL